MTELTMEMMLTGNKPSPAPVAAAHGGKGGKGPAAPEARGEGGFSEALSREMNAAAKGPEEARAMDAADTEGAADDVEGAAEEGRAAAEAPVDEAEEEGGDEAVAEELTAILDLPVELTVVPVGGNALPAEAEGAAEDLLPAQAAAAGRGGLPGAAAAGARGGSEGGQGDAHRAAAPLPEAALENASERGAERGFAQALAGRLPAGAEARAEGDAKGASVTQLSSLSAQAAPNASQSAATAAPARSAIETPVRQAGWNDSLGNRVVWMAKEKIDTAEIRLNPRNLGPMEVRITMNGDQASVTFVSHNATVRDALEAAVPRLREMMGEQGLNLADVNVSSQGRDERAAGGSDEGGGDRRGGGDGGLAEGEGEEGIAPPMVAGLGMLDLYA